MIKKVSKEEFLKKPIEQAYALTPDGRKWYDVTETNYPSKRNYIGLSGYPKGFGVCQFLPKGTRFFIKGDKKMEKINQRFCFLEKATKNEISKRITQLNEGLISAEEFLYFSARIKNKYEKNKLFIFKTAFK